MKYIFDFDRTLFDTDRFVRELRKMGKENLEGQIASLDEVSPEELIFEDAREFLMSHPREDLYIVSSCLGTRGQWDIEYQREKVRRSRIGELVHEVFVVELSKVEAIGSLGLSFEAVFVDDMLTHLEEVRAVFPSVRVICIRRSGEPLEALYDIPVISSFRELDAILEASVG